MDRPIVLFLHRDPVVHELVGGTLGDAFSFVSARAPKDAIDLAAAHQPAVVLIDVESAESAASLIAELRARDPHLRAIFFADAREPGRAWVLSDLGIVLPKAYDLERLRLAIQKAARLHALSAGAERARGELPTTRRIPAAASAASADTTATARIQYGAPRQDRESTTRPDPGKGRAGRR